MLGLRLISRAALRLNVSPAVLVRKIIPVEAVKSIDHGHKIALKVKARNAGLSFQQRGHDAYQNGPATQDPNCVKISLLTRGHY
jgi:hypothetical protein